MLVHVTEMIHSSALARLQQEADVVTWESPSVFDLRNAEGVIVRAARMSREVQETAPNLRVIGKHGVGTDTIDLAAARELGKTVVYTPNANMDSVAELAIGLMLAAARLIPQGFDVVREASLTAWPPKNLGGIELSGKTIALVGFGRVGQRVAVIAQKGFGMRAVGFDRFVSAQAFATLGVERVETVEVLLSQADYINISVPHTPETVNLIDEARLALCKPSAILVNTARGGIVNEEALFQALFSGALRAAAVDVLDKEPAARDHPLLSLPNFIATPHVGANTEESLIRMGNTVVDDVLRVLRGEAPRYPHPGL